MTRSGQNQSHDKHKLLHPFQTSSYPVASPPRIAVVTGASRGLGKALSTSLANNGYTVIHTQRHYPNPQIKVPSNVMPATLDLSVPDSIHNFATQLLNDIPYLDLLINNAAICPAPPTPSTHDHLHAALSVNFTAPVRLTEQLLPLLVRSPSHPRVINISSGDGELLFFEHTLRRRLERLADHSSVETMLQRFETLQETLLANQQWQHLVFNGQPAYKLSKAALNAYTRVAARRAAQHYPYGGVAFVAVCPGDVDTRMADEHAKLISPLEAVRLMGTILDVSTPCQNGAFLRHGEEISW